MQQTKLLPYKPPDADPVTSQSNSPDFNYSSLNLPLGNELIVHNLPYDHPRMPLEAVKKAIETLHNQFPTLQKVMAYSARRENANHCYVTLHPDITGTLTSPHPDLLHQWGEPLRKFDAEWNVAWSPQKDKDRWAWVQVMNVGNGDDALGEVDIEVKREILDFAKLKGQ